MAIDGLRRLELWARLGYAARGCTIPATRWRCFEDRDVVDDLERGFEKGVEKVAASVKS